MRAALVLAGLILVLGLPVLLVVTMEGAEAREMSANNIMPGCRSALTREAKDYPAQGYCQGLVRGVWDMAKVAGNVCGPNGATNEQGVRVVVEYIDQANPARLRERFTHLALEALRAAWPCE
jgi:hypothetical protein